MTMYSNLQKNIVEKQETIGFSWSQSLKKCHKSKIQYFPSPLFKYAKGLIQYNLMMSSSQKQNFLRVGFDRNRGMKLQWDFKDLTSKQRYFRHIFVICLDNEEQIFCILENFYKKMKYGDLFCCIYTHQNYDCMVGKWIEKSQLNSFRLSRYLRERSKRTIDQSLKLKLINCAGNQGKQFDQPVVINFLGADKAQIQFYKNEILRQRKLLKGKKQQHLNYNYEYITNIFGDFQYNRISVHLGINYFKLNVQNIEEYADYYHKFINGSVVQMAQISIQSHSGQLSLFNEALWRNADFNRIQATYYGPSAQYQLDHIYFYNQQQSPEIQHEFQIKLNIKLFSRKVLSTTKRVKISFLSDKQCFPTFQMARYNSFFVYKSISLCENPFKCEIIVKYKNQREERKQISV